MPSLPKPLHGPLAALVALAVALPGLGTSGLLDPWEMDRAAVARQVAGAPRVLVVDAKGKLLDRLEDATEDAFALSRGDGAPAMALARLDDKLSRRVHHAVVIDADAVLRGRDGARGEDLLAGRLDALRTNNRGMLVLLVTAGEPDKLRRAVAKGRARLLRAAMAGGWWQHAMPAAADAHKLWPLMAQSDLIATSDKAAEVLLASCPSPWALVQHKVDGVSVQAPLLDTWLVAASLRVFGSSELSVRLPGALCLAALAWLLVAGGGLLFGTLTGWLAVLVLLTTPLALGSARIVTLAQAAPVGMLALTLGLAMGASRRSPWWWLLVGGGLLTLLLGGGLGSLSVGVAVLLGYVLVSRDLRPGMLAAAGAAALTLGLAAWIVLTDDDSALLRSLRFTRIPFGGGLPDGRRDFSELVSHLGFGLYPWGPVFLVGCGRLLSALDKPSDDSRRDIAVLLGFGAPLLGTAMLMPEFHHVGVPVAATVALITATLLADVLAGKVSGGVLALLIFVPALLLHRETGKDASTLVRWLAYDPPFGGERAAHVWPRELAMHRAARAITLLLTLGFGLAMARPVTALRGLADRIQTRRATLLALVAVATAWTLDVVISLGTRLDVLLRAEATRTGYHYDRVWTTIQMTRPEVVAGATLFVVVLIGGVLIDIGRARGYAEKAWARLLRAVSTPFSMPLVARAITAAAAIAVLVSGVMVHLDQRREGWGSALAAGAMSGAFIAPLIVAAIAGLLSALPDRLGERHDWASDRRATALSMALAQLRGGRLLAIAMPLLIAVAGLGIGASQGGGTWSYGYLAATWWLAVSVGLSVGGRGANLGAWLLSGVAIAAVVAGNCWSVLAGRLLAEPSGPGLRYLVKLLVGSPDTLGLLLLIGVIVVNRAAVRRGGVEVLRRWAWKAAGLVERPRTSVLMIGLAAVVLGGGYAYGLLPGMSLHFSQKHLLARVQEAGGTADKGEVPRTYKHARGGTSSIQNNFYTRAMPTISDRDAVLDLLAGRDVATRISDYGERGRSFEIAIPGWADANDKDGDGKRDHPALAAIARKVDGLTVTLSPPMNLGTDAPALKLAADAWKGARLFAPREQVVNVLGNDAAQLRLAAPTSLIGGDPSRGLVVLDKNPVDFGAPRSSAMARGSRFVVLAKDEFSAINHAFRARHGRQLKVLDARSSRLVLAASALPQDAKDENWLAGAVFDQARFDKLKGVTRMRANFDNHIELIGYKLANRAVRRSQKYDLRLYWRVHKPLSVSYKLFMHPHPLHADQWPLAYKPNDKNTEKRCQGCFQTDHWRKGDIIEVPIIQEVPLGTSAGPNDIIIGWYNPLNDKRLQVISARGAGVFKHQDNRITVGKLQVR